MPLLKSTQPSGQTESVDVRDQNVTYVKAYTEGSFAPIHFEERLIFEDGYKFVKSPLGVNGKPKVLFEFAKTAKKDNGSGLEIVTPVQVKDNLIVPPRQKTNSDGSSTVEKQLLFYLTDENKLYNIDPESGQILASVFLGPAKAGGAFTTLRVDSFWDTEFLIARTSSNPSDVSVKRFALFGLRPFRFVTMFDVLKNINGEKVTAAFLVENLLVLQSGINVKAKMKLFSFNEVMLRNSLLCSCDIGEDCEVRGHGSLGAETHGILPNMVLTSLPPVIRTINSSEIVDFGGAPFAVVYKTSDEKFFIVENLKTGEEILRLPIEKAVHGQENHSYFFQDDLNVVVMERGNCVEVHSLGHDEAHKSFKLDFGTHVSSSYDINSSRPRRASVSIKPMTGDEQVYNVRNVHGCADSNILAVLFRDTATDGPKDAAVGLYDSRTGDLIKKLSLGFKIEDSIDYIFVYYPEYFAVMENPTGTNLHKMRLFVLTLIDGDEAMNTVRG